MMKVTRLALAAISAASLSHFSTAASAAPAVAGAGSAHRSIGFVELARHRRGARIGVGAGIIGGAIIGSALAGSYYYAYRPHYRHRLYRYAYYPRPYYYYSGPTYYDLPPDDDVAYCMRRFRSYDLKTGTYLGYDGHRHPCP